MSHSPAALNPTGGADRRRDLTQPALHEVNMEAVVAAANVAKAWKRVKSNRGAPGIDGMRVEDFADHTRVQWPAIRQSLLAGKYQPQPVRRVLIPKSGGGERELGIPTVLDRVIQQALAQVMTPVFDPNFSESSFGFRPKRSAHGAVKQVQAHIKAGYRLAVDLDLRKFFDNVDHDILMHRVSRTIGDQRILHLIGVRGAANVHWTFGRRSPCAQAYKSARRCNPATWAHHKAGPCRRCWPIFCLMIWTLNWKEEAIASRDTPTICWCW